MKKAYGQLRLSFLCVIVVFCINLGCVACIESVFLNSELIDVPELAGTWDGKHEHDSTPPNIEEIYESISVKRLEKGVYSVEGAGLGGKVALLRVFKHGDSIYGEIQQLPESESDRTLALFAPSVIRPIWILKLEIGKQKCVVHTMNSLVLNRNLLKSKGLRITSIGELTHYNVLTGDPKEIRSVIETTSEQCFQNRLSFNRKNVE